MYKLFRKKIYLAILLLTSVLLIGVAGFRFLSNYSWLDALYMTVITLSTVGFGEVAPLDNTSKLFTVFLIFTSVVIFGFSISIITEYILSKSNSGDFKRKKIKKMIDKLEGHIIIVGYGRNGRQVAGKLHAHKKTFVVIERDREVIERYEGEGLLFIEGNATEDDTLLRSGLEKASYLITALPEDADNLFVVLSARQMNKNLRIISRASQETSYKKIRLAGADNVIMPDRIGGDHMASLVVVPDLLEFLDNLSIVGDKTINIEQISFEEMFRKADERSIRAIDLRSKTGCTIIGYKAVNGEYIVNPEAETIFKAGSKIIVLGRPDQIASLHKEFGIRSPN